MLSTEGMAGPLLFMYVTINIRWFENPFKFFVITTVINLKPSDTYFVKFHELFSFFFFFFSPLVFLHNPFQDNIRDISYGVKLQILTLVKLSS